MSFFAVFAQNIHETFYIMLKTTQMVKPTRYGTYIYEIFQFYLLLGDLGAENYTKMAEISIKREYTKKYIFFNTSIEFKYCIL